MPDSSPTRFTRLVGKWLCLASYALCIAAAYGDARYPGVTIAPVDDSLVAVSGLAMAVLGCIGLLAVLTHWWRVEWVPASALTFLLLSRAAPMWADLDNHPTRLAAAALMTLGALCIAKRALDLLVFFEQTRLAAHLKD